MKKLKKPVSILLTLTMIVSLFTIIPFEASAVEGQTVSYRARYWDSRKIRDVINSQDNVKPLSSCVDNTSLSGWYYTDKNFEVGSRVKVADSAFIILMKGKTVTFKKGIRVADGKELNIYPDVKSDNGKLIATADGYDAAIGSNDEDDGDEDKAGTVNIYGGTIEATGGTDGAGIGGGNEAKGGTVNIYGGTITARGGNYAAGIGGGDECSGGTVNIYGGRVYAYGGQDAAGIGGGEDGSGADYTQYGGSILAWGGKADTLSAGGGAGVGGGECGSQGGTVNIHGGSLMAQYGPCGGAGIGGGHDASGGTVNITGGTVQAAGEWGAAIGAASTTPTEPSISQAVT